MPFSTTYANNFLSYTFGKLRTLPPAPQRVYMGLCTNDPEADMGVFNEVSVSNYERVLITQREDTLNSSGLVTSSAEADYPKSMTDAQDRSITNLRQINWNKAREGWPRVYGYGLFSAPEGGAPFFFARVDNPEGVEVAAGAVALFEPGALRLSFPWEDADAAALACV